ncbi:PLDc N-terminal domain-containing protein [Actinophytocola sp.]|uniref:PLDc N-terminal domain-containing protein n=1 Tax=Actinophytocola sp. TaxID=1872138 RepID=UPI002D32FC48|nr:PLDc N-terminal domain-containing protein [Actinophytocola sp.]HYQ63402.1 PLDc N-terminal domain-containing protein [Actinophytocola sp.]
MVRKHWRDLSTPQHAAFVAASAVQLGLAAAAWADLARRPQQAVNGRKPLWAMAIAVNFVGPIAYLWLGRRTTGSTP